MTRQLVISGIDLLQSDGTTDKGYPDTGSYERGGQDLALALIAEQLQSINPSLSPAAMAAPATDLMIESTGLSWTTLVITGVTAAAVLSILQWRRRRDDNNQ